MITDAELLPIPLFAALPAPLRARVARHAADLRVATGEWIVHDGDVAAFWVVLAGEVEALKEIAGELVRKTTFDDGEFFGEVPMLLGAAAFTGIRALKPTRLARIDAIDFHLMVTESPEAAAIFTRTLLRRVSYIRDAYVEAPVVRATIVGDRDDPQCYGIRDFLARNQIAYEWLDPADDADAGCLPAAATNEPLPLVVVGDRALPCPTMREVAEALDLQTEPGRGCYDVVVIGGGPAGLAAAVYGGSEGLHTMMIEREAPGGQAGTSSRIENYLGFPGGLSGGDLANRALQQAKRFESEILVTRTVETIRAAEDHHVVVLDGGLEVRARAVVVATGVAWRRLDVEGADRLLGRGIAYGAARTEALAAHGKDVYLVGGGNSAGQAAMFFSAYARRVTLLVRGSSLASSMSHYLIEQLATRENVTVETETTVCGVEGETHLTALRLRDARTQAVTTRPADALFVFIGAAAETDWLPRAVERDDRGYLCTGRDLAAWTEGRAPFSLETSVPGIFAAGDVRSGSIKRVASGVGEGSMVISYVHQYLTDCGPRSEPLTTAPR